MNKSKKACKRRNKKTINKSKKVCKKRNNTFKNKSSLQLLGGNNIKKCEQFCKKDYVVEMNKVFKKSAEKYNMPYKSPTKEENELTYNTCKKTFCNEKCKGYDFFGDKKQQLAFNKKIKNGFQNSYSKEKVKKLKNRGALSGCVDIGDFPL